jgi:hypothetical protein
MSEIDLQLVDRYWARFDEVATDAETGSDVSADLDELIEALIDHLSPLDDGRTQLETMVRDLQLNAEAFREDRPAYASVLSRASVKATRAWIERSA